MKDFIFYIVFDDSKIDVEDIENVVLNAFKSNELIVMNKDALKRFCKQFEKVQIPLEQFSTKISDVNRFKELNEPISGDKWDYLDRYYFKPLEYELNKLQEIYSEIAEEQWP